MPPNSMNVYLDHAATTPLDPQVLQEMLPYFCDVYGNANSQHQVGQRAENAVDRARDAVAQTLGAGANEIYFTSGGTESDNWAIKGVALANRDKGKRVLTTAIEHHAVLNAAAWLAKEGYQVDYLPVSADGLVDPDAFARALRPDTVLASVMCVNNEVGTVQPIRRLADICHQSGVLLHTDAVQAVGAVDTNVRRLGVDLMSISAHKFYGPKGVGALYVKNGVRIEPLIAGGSQERGLRGGTTNTPLVVGLAVALRRAVDSAEADNMYVASLRDRFVQSVCGRLKGVRLNGSADMRVPGNANLYIEGVRGESALLSLDLAGISAGLGSACTAGTTEPSHVLMAMGLSRLQAMSSIRFSFGKHNTDSEVDYAADVLVDTVNRLRGWQ